MNGKTLHDCGVNLSIPKKKRVLDVRLSMSIL